MQINSSEFQNLLFMVFALISFIAFGIWFLVDTYRISQFKGKIKRGIKVWSRELSNKSWQYLFSLKQDVVEAGNADESLADFIRIQEGEILICSHPAKFESSWVCVGYVDLSSPSYELEYRMSLPGLIFLLPFTVFGFLIFFLPSFLFYRKSIDSFIERKTNETNSKPSTFQRSNLETL